MSASSPAQQEAEPMEVCDTESASEPVPAHDRRSRPWALLHVDDTTPRSQIDQFLDTHRPSQCTTTMIPWISVVGSGYDRGPVPDPDTMVREWRWFCTRDPSSATVDTLHSLARRYSVLSGKWLVFAKRESVDRVWNDIVMAVALGQLGSMAKVAPRSADREKDEHVICVYADNYFDTNEVGRLRATLRSLGHHSTLLFKPDVFTYCGIYEANEWGIPTYVYSE